MILAALIPIAMPRNDGLYSVVTTPLAVILVEVHAGASPALVESRVLDTVLGCALARRASRDQFRRRLLDA